MRPTRRGMILIGACLVLYFVAWRSLFGWFYMANAVAWAVVLTNLFFPWWNLRRLAITRRVHRTAPQDVYEGDTMRVDLELTNPRISPSFVLTAIEQCPLAPPDRVEKRFLFGMVAPHSSVTAHYSETCHQRGEFHFDPIVLETSAPFGLFRARRRIEARSSVLVYPEVFPASGINVFSGPVERQSLASPARHVGEFRGSREYRIGDSLRSIHWRSSARQRQLMVKQYDKSPENQVTLVFDATRTFGEGKETTLEYSIKLAASVARDCFQRSTPMVMVPPGPSLDTSDWRAVLDYLARLELARGPTLEDSLAAGVSHGRLLTIVALADHRGIEAFAQIPAGRLAAVVVLRGFTSAEENVSDLENLQRSAVPVVICELGDIPSALTDLARLAPSLSVTRHERIGAVRRMNG